MKLAVVNVSYNFPKFNNLFFEIVVSIQEFSL